MRSIETQLKNTITWANTIVEHWQRLDGIVRNDKAYWHDTYHSRTKQDWQDFVDVIPQFQFEYPEIFAKHANFNTAVIEQRLRAGQPVIKKYVQDYNTPVFAVVMEFKDIFHKIIGVPVKTPSKTPPPSDLKTIKTATGPKISKKELNNHRIFANLFDIEHNDGKQT
jgi:hypothetical protein